MDIDARTEGGVDCRVKVRRQENDALKVFEFAKEDCEERE